METGEENIHVDIEGMIVVAPCNVVSRLRAVSLLLESPRGKKKPSTSRALRSHVTRAWLLFPADLRAKERLLAV